MAARGPRWQSGNTLTSHLRGSIPGTASSGKVGSCLPLVDSLQYGTLTNCMVLVSSVLPTTHHDMTCSVESDIKPQINKLIN